MIHVYHIKCARMSGNIRYIGTRVAGHLASASKIYANDDSAYVWVCVRASIWNVPNDYEGGSKNLRERIVCRVIKFER